MPLIELTTKIYAPQKRCFDLSRSIDLHVISTAHTGEKAVAGKVTGLLELGETVTWQARHLGFQQKLTIKMEALRYPTYFCDIMTRGAFTYMRHEHHFDYIKGRTLMVDRFEFESPLGFVGQVFNALILTRYMTDFLIERNMAIKEYAESEKWRKVLPAQRAF